MSNISKILVVVLVVLALLLGLFAFRLARQPAAPAPVAATDSQPAAQPVPTVDVLVAARAVAAGQALVEQDLKIEGWQVAPGQSLRSAQDAVGKHVRVALAPGEPVLDSTLMRGLATYLEEGQRAVTIPIDEVVGAAGRIMPGDMVDVFFSLERGNEVQGTQSRLLQSRVRVLAYGEASVDGPPPGSQDADAKARNGNRPGSARQAILAVPVAQVNELLLAARSGALQLALRAPGDAQLPDQTLFATRAPVLAGKPGLSTEQRALLDDDVNKAFAGDSLPALSGPVATPPPAPVAARPAGGGGGGGRSIEVIRAGERESVRY